MTVTFRTDGPWGFGKGSRLTKVEVDENFWDHEQRIRSVETNAPLPLDIQQILVVGNQMTIILSDGYTTFGPFTLPTAAFNFTGPFQTLHAYKYADLFVVNDGLYFVLSDYTSGATFNFGPELQLIMPFRTTYVAGFFAPGKPGFGIAPGSSMFIHVFTEDVTMPEDLTGSFAILDHAPLDDLSFPITKDGDSIGSINFVAYSVLGTFIFPADVSFTAGDRIKVLPPTAIDVMALDLAVSLNGELTGLT